MSVPKSTDNHQVERNVEAIAVGEPGAVQRVQLVGFVVAVQEHDQRPRREARPPTIAPS